MASLTETIMAGLADGSARFEYVDTTETPSFNLPFASVSSAFSGSRPKQLLFFAKRPSIRAACNKVFHWRDKSQALKEHFEVRKIDGNGRSMFRALAQGMARNDGRVLNSTDEEEEADKLRFKVKDALCGGSKRRDEHKKAVDVILLDRPFEEYCERIPSSDFSGGESELLVLSKMHFQPITVYIPDPEAKRGAGSGYKELFEYGSEYTTPGKDWNAHKPVRLLYDKSKDHYDLLTVFEDELH